MANKNPVLGVVSCTTPSCDGTMQVKDRKTGRSSVLKKCGYCPTCRKTEQRNEMQDHLNSYRAATPVATVEPAPSVQPKAVSKPDSEGFDPHEITHLTPEKTPAEKPAKRKRGGLLKWVVGGIVVIGTLAGVGYAAGR